MEPDHDRRGDETLRERLRASGLRATGPRMAILARLTRETRPRTASEIFHLLGPDHGDFATVYRNLGRLTEAGLLQIVTVAEGVPRYARVEAGTPDQHVHPHFVCTTCGRIECLPAAAITGVDPWNRAVDDMMVQVRGQCPGCSG